MPLTIWEVVIIADAMNFSALWPIILGLGIVIFIIAIAVYIYASLALMTIAKKMKIENPWMAWIPIANVYLMTQMAKLPGWYTLGIFLTIIPFIGGLAVMALMAYIWWKIAEALGKEGWLGILMIIPIVNLVLLGIWAWGK